MSTHVLAVDQETEANATQELLHDGTILLGQVLYECQFGSMYDERGNDLLSSSDALCRRLWHRTPPRAILARRQPTSRGHTVRPGHRGACCSPGSSRCRDPVCRDANRTSLVCMSLLKSCVNAKTTRKGSHRWQKRVDIQERTMVLTSGTKKPAMLLLVGREIWWRKR